jgi:nitrite reductase (cytochrome c-552)
MKPLSERIRQKPWMGWLLFFATMFIVFLLGILASSVLERRTEAVFAYTPQVTYSQFEPRNQVWGQIFPREYQSYLATSDTTLRTKYNGSATIDMLSGDPRLVVLWAGYPFSKDYKQSRGHYYAVNDIRNTLRTGAPAGDQKSPMPNTCWTCKSPDVPRLMNELGVIKFYEGSWETRGHEVINPIGCADCHDSKSMNLRISRPALIEAYERMGKDITMASHQEMRSLVCAQCHVEYYFNKKRVDAEGIAYLTFPWDGGFSVEAMEEYYDEIEFSDWTHALSKAPMLKAQHPDYEVYLTGTHASRGVSCADCHMPYISEGGQKFTSHHVTSPLQNISTSCQVCHRQETERLVRDVYERQDKIIQMRDTLEILLVRAHTEAKKAWDLGATEKQMQPVLQDIRHAQWRWDYAAASHGASFHAPVEVGRVISTGIAITLEARLELARLLADLGYNRPVPYPPIATKSQAQDFIGLEMKKLNAEKNEFINTVIPEWIEKGKAREKSYPGGQVN